MDTAPNPAHVDSALPPLDPSLVAQLKGQHGDDLYLVNPKYNIVMKCPPQPDWRRFIKMSTDDGKRADAISQLARSCVVWVQGAASSQAQHVWAAWDALLARRPGLAESIGGMCAELARDEEPDAAKKL